MPDAERGTDLSWVERTQTVDAIETAVVRAFEDNPGWRLLHVGTGSGGQTTLTFGWPWPDGFKSPHSDGDEGAHHG